MTSDDNPRAIDLNRGNYNEKFRDYVDNSTNHYHKGDRIPDEITGIPNNLPRFKSNYFVGRDADLNNLHQLLQKSKSVAISAISGMGGIGKTELAIQYALKYQDQYPGSICWLRAREDIGTQIVQFAKSSLNLHVRDDLDLVGQVQYCWNHWSEKNSLVILDDVPNYGEYYRKNIQAYLRSVKSNIKILSTSRQKPGKNIEHLDLDILSPKAAFALIISLAEDSQIDFEQEKESLERLCKWLGYLPLGLELVGRYLDLHPTFTIGKVIQKLEERKLDARSLIHRQDSDMVGQLGVAAAFDLSWNEIPSTAQELGCYLGLFNSDPFIWSWVKDGLLEGENGEEAEELRDLYLLRFNLLKINSNQQYQLHSLIAQYFQAKLATLENSELLKQKFIQPLIAISQSIPSIPTQEDITRVALAIPHLSNLATDLVQYVGDDDLFWVNEPEFDKMKPRPYAIAKK
ncbi:putative ATPase [Xenococcus sp. PCC 7305]|uniref:NB-ARC domain-containing protein n=1 Tax=Xenococcus sp. PCC 7305 TaxID=102125 RepID=UPI0002AC98CC|nr:NB-ARC domain-containing protein [Xenococcus sp. PCC 7305]ELS02352.1 putative ATPase [Xenococcus sp. PCC 7305]